MLYVACWRATPYCLVTAIRPRGEPITTHPPWSLRAPTESHRKSSIYKAPFIKIGSKVVHPKNHVKMTAKSTESLILETQTSKSRPRNYWKAWTVNTHNKKHCCFQRLPKTFKMWSRKQFKIDRNPRLDPKVSPLVLRSPPESLGFPKVPKWAQQACQMTCFGH